MNHTAAPFIELAAMLISFGVGMTIATSQGPHPWRNAARIGFVVSIVVIIVELTTGVINFPDWWYLYPRSQGLASRAGYLLGYFSVYIAIYIIAACFGYLIRKVAVRFVALANGFYIATFRCAPAPSDAEFGDHSCPQKEAVANNKPLKM